MKENQIPKTLAFSFRGDLRDIAAIIDYLETHANMRVRSKSQAIRFIVSTFVDMLVETKKVERFESQTEAVRFLTSRNLLDLHRELLTEATKELVKEDLDGIEPDLRNIGAEIEVDDEAVSKRAKELLSTITTGKEVKRKGGGK